MFKNIRNLVKFIFMILSLIVLGKIFLNYYNKKNMKVIKKDEEDIIKQELQEPEDLETYFKESEPNVLSEEEKDLGVVTQKQPEI